MTVPRERGGLLLRLGFLLFLAGGLALWSELRRPRDLRLELDLTSALPGEIVELDVTVLRDDARSSASIRSTAAAALPPLCT